MRKLILPVLLIASASHAQTPTEDFAAERAICDANRTPIHRQVQGEAYTPYVGADMNATCTAIDARIEATIQSNLAATQAANAAADLAKLRALTQGK